MSIRRSFSQMVLVGEGQTVHLKGQVSLDPDGAVVGAGDMPEQVLQVLSYIEPRWV